jgi:hypothetical protein
MIRVRVHRERWEFAELAERWGFKKDERHRDLRRLIIQRALTPYSWFRTDLQPLVLLQEGPIAAGDPVQFSGELWLAQELGVQVDTFEYLYPAVRDRREHEGAQYWALPEPTTLSAVLATFVVSDENVRCFEDQQRIPDADRALSQRQEKTRDVMLVTMARELYGWEPGGDRSTGATELIAQAKTNGFSLSYPTVREHLRLAWERCPPTDDPAGDTRRPYGATAAVG